MQAKRLQYWIAACLAVVVAVGSSVPADAAKARGHSQNNVNANSNRNSNVNVNSNRNTNVNVNSNRNVNVDVDVHHHGGYYGGCCYHDDYHPAAVITGAIVTAAVIGSIVNSVPSGCSTVIVNGFAYQQCGNTWYQPQISGSSTTYIVVNAPR